jgi:hypothetical protein
MRLTAVTILSFALSITAFAQLRPGAVVPGGGNGFAIVADFNGDGLDDLIQEKNILLSDGNAPTIVYMTGISQNERVIGVGDVNGDHRLDLLTLLPPQATPPSVGGDTGTREYIYRLYVADASRNFDKGIKITSGRQPAFVDANDDGRDDLLLFADVRGADGARNIATEVTVMLSNGDGTFDRLSPVIRIGADVQADARALAGDLNHDGKTDVVIRCNNDLVVLRGRGDGRFAPESRYLPFTTEFGWWSARLADIDGDANLDVVIPGMRAVRVFFGDGHGNFTRTMRAGIDQRHGATLPAGLEFLDLDRMSQPKDLAIGHFTRGDRNEIAAGTGEGDIAIFAFEQGQLREVSRTPTEFWMTSLRAGSFRTRGVSDLFAMGTLIWGDNWPRPRIYSADPVGTSAVTSIGVAGPRRGRAATPPALSRAVSMELRGDCVDAIAGRFDFSREGIFGTAQRGDAKIEGVFDDGVIYARITAPFTLEPAMTTLTATGNAFSGMASTLTPCGWRSVMVTANIGE